MLRAMSTAPSPLNRSKLMRSGNPARRQAELARAIVAVNAVLLVAGALLSWRRLWGAMDGELARPALLATALFAATIAAGSRIIWRRMFPTPSTRTGEWLDQFVGWAGSAAMILIAVGCCYPGNWNSDWLIWFPLVIADQFWRQTYFDNGRPGGDLEEPQASNVVTLKPSAEVASSLSATTEPQESSPLQQLFRVRLPNGDEAIYGSLRADFLKNQRHATLHVGFCPPLAAQPEIEADACHGADVRIKVVQALAHGVRLDVRLTSPAVEPRAVQIDMAALPKPPMEDRIGA